MNVDIDLLGQSCSPTTHFITEVDRCMNTITVSYRDESDMMKHTDELYLYDFNVIKVHDSVPGHSTTYEVPFNL